MTKRLSITNFTLLAITISFISACAHSGTDTKSRLTPVGQCTVYEGQGETTEYTVEIGVSSFDAEETKYFLGIQGFHPNDTSPQRIVEIRLAGIGRVPAQQLSNECVCGVSFARSDEMCGYVSTYKAPIPREWLERALAQGLRLFFELENGLVVEGPLIRTIEIDEVLTDRLR